MEDRLVNSLLNKDFNMCKVLCRLLVGIIATQLLMACTSQQVKRGTYYSIHERQRQQCIDEGRVDCSQYDYDSYDEYQRKKDQTKE